MPRIGPPWFSRTARYRYGNLGLSSRCIFGEPQQWRSPSLALAVQIRRNVQKPLEEVEDRERGAWCLAPAKGPGVEENDCPCPRSSGLLFKRLRSCPRMQRLREVVPYSDHRAPQPKKLE